MDLNFSAQTAHDEGEKSTKSSSASSSDWSDPEAKQRARECEQEAREFEMEHKHRYEEECHDGCPAGNDSGLSVDAGDSLQLTQNLSLDSDENRLIIDEDEDAPEEDD